MVEFKDPNSPVEEGFDNRVFIIPAIVIISLVGELVVASLWLCVTLYTIAFGTLGTALCLFVVFVVVL